MKCNQSLIYNHDYNKYKQPVSMITRTVIENVNNHDNK